MGAAHVGHVDRVEARIGGEAADILLRQVLDLRLAEARGTGDQRREAERAVEAREVDDHLARQLDRRLHVVAREGLEVDVRGHEHDVADAVARLQRVGAELGMARPQPLQRLAEQRRAAAVGHDVDQPRARAGQQRERALDVGDVGARPRAVGHVVPEHHAGRPLEGDHRRVAEEVGERAHLHRDLVEVHAVAVHVEHEVRIADARQLGIDRGDEGRVGRGERLVLAGRTEHLDRLHRADPWLLHRAPEVRRDHCSQLQPGSPRRTSATPSVTPSPGASMKCSGPVGRPPRGREEHRHARRAQRLRRGALEVEARVLEHRGRRREVRLDRRAAAEQRRREGERGGRQRRSADDLLPVHCVPSRFLPAS